MIDSPAILIDTTRCNGCEVCVLACKEVNNLGPDRLRPGQEAVDSLSSTRFTTILRRAEENFVKQQCRHCLDPACVSVCLVGALQKSPEGPVIYDSDLCIGCRYCLVACPWGIPRYQWDETVPYVRKCTLCYPRLKEGKIPACVDACPREALLFGNRKALLAEAHRRIEGSSGAYQPHVYGEHEVGGTSVLYVSDVSLDFLGWSRSPGEEPLPLLTWASLTKVPPVILGMGTLMGGIHWVIRRRMQLAVQKVESIGPGEAEHPSTSAPASGKGGDDA